MKFIKSILLSALCLVSVIQLSAQAQNFSCDSLSYTVLQGLPLTVYGGSKRNNKYGRFN